MNPGFPETPGRGRRNSLLHGIQNFENWEGIREAETEQQNREKERVKPHLTEVQSTHGLMSDGVLIFWVFLKRG